MADALSKARAADAAGRWSSGGVEVAVGCAWDGVDLIVGRADAHYAFAVRPQVAAQLAWFILRWWACTMWFGLRARLVERALAKRLDKEARRDRRKEAQDLPRRGSRAA